MDARVDGRRLDVKAHVANKLLPSPPFDYDSDPRMSRNLKAAKGLGMQTIREGFFSPINV